MDEPDTKHENDSTLKPPETSGFFVSARSSNRIQVNFSNHNMLKDIFDDKENDLLATKTKYLKSKTSKPKFTSTVFKTPRSTGMPKPVPVLMKPVLQEKLSVPQAHTDDSRLNDSDDFSQEFDDDLVLALKTNPKSQDSDPPSPVITPRRRRRFSDSESESQTKSQNKKFKEK